MYFKTVSLALCVIFNIGHVVSELLGPYQCPSDSRCQDVNSCTSAYKKKTASGKLFYCGPQNRMDYMVCCMEKELNWDQPSVDDVENEILAMLMPKNGSMSPSSNFEFGYNRTKSDGPTSIITNILPTDNKPGYDHSPGHELDDIFGQQENMDSGNSLYSNNANIYNNQDPLPQAPLGPGANPPDLKRDSRKSFAECNCERGPAGPPGPPGENGKVIYVPILISSSTPTMSLPADVAANIMPYLQQMQVQSSNPQFDSQTQTGHLQSPNSQQNTQRQVPGPPPYYSYKAPSYATNASPSPSATLQNKIKRHSHF